MLGISYTSQILWWERLNVGTGYTIQTMWREKGKCWELTSPVRCFNGKKVNLGNQTPVRCCDKKKVDFYLLHQFDTLMVNRSRCNASSQILSWAKMNVTCYTSEILWWEKINRIGFTSQILRWGKGKCL